MLPRPTVSVYPSSAQAGSIFTIKSSFIKGHALKFTIRDSSGAVSSPVALLDDESSGDAVKDDGTYTNVIDTKGAASGSYFVDVAVGDKTLKNAAVFTVTEPGSGCVKVVNRGSSSEKIDLVFVPNNYENSELANFAANILPRHFNYLLSKEPFASHAYMFNVWYLPNPQPFDCSYSNAKNCKDHYKSLVSSSCGFYDDVLVLDKNSLKETGYSFERSGSFQATGQSSSPGTEVLTLHEFGHTFGNLADEYDAPKRISDTNAPNCDVAACPKWCSTSANLKIPECYKLADKTSCETMKYSYSFNVEGVAGWRNVDVNCVWTRTGNTDVCSFPYSINAYASDVSFASSCESGAACYYGCDGQQGFRSSKHSIMGDAAVREFNDVSKRHIEAVLQCCYSGVKGGDDVAFCTDWNKRNGGAYSACISKLPAVELPVPKDGSCEAVAGVLVVSKDTKICKDVYRAAGGVPPQIVIATDNVLLDCDGASLVGEKSSGYGIKIAGASNVEIRNCKASGYSYGLYAKDSNNVKVLDSDFSGNFKLVDSSAFLDILRREPYGGGILFENVNGGLVRGNVLRNQQDGLSFIDVKNVEVRENKADHNAGWGIKLYHSAGNTIDGNDFSHTLRACDADSPSLLCKAAGLDSDKIGCGCDTAAMLLVSSSNDNAITNNNMRHSGDGLFIDGKNGLPSTSNYIANNDASYSPHNAFEDVFNANNKFVDNVASYSNYGFWLSYSKNILVDGNTAIGSLQDGIAADRGSGFIIKNNDLSQGTNGINIFSGTPERGYESSESTDYYITNNIFSRNKDSAIRIENTGSVTISSNNFECGTCLKLIHADSSSKISVANNWFGSADESKFKSLIVGNVKYNPWLSKPVNIGGGLK
ncbi:MAG: right-handed parallel beta-helix repeat-containing protein [Candidatus Aenigmarchaeota archaeon]|nr:right-handed parallel beta-helix repeat-containing protein [Candidatus Aenigmarchaeota archaeon]